MAADVWSAGDAYEPYIGRWSRLVGREFLRWLSPEPRRRWLDVGCGTGALSGVVLASADPATVLGVDPSAGFVDHARSHVRDHRAEFQVGDALALPVPDAGADYVVSGLVLNFVPDPAAALAEMIRVVAPEGTVAAYLWDYAEGMQLIRRFWDEAVALDPAAADRDEAARFPLCRPGPLAELFAGAGLVDVRSTSIVVPTVFTSFADYWTPFLGGAGPAPAYCATLSDEMQEQLRQRLAARLPARRDGSIPLTARAWAVAARRPSDASTGPRDQG